MIRQTAPTRWERLVDAVRSITLGPYNSKDPTLARLFGASPNSAGVSVNESTALTYSAVWQAVTLIAGDVGSLPLPLYKRLKGGGKERFIDHPLYYILHDTPNPEMSSMVFRETLQAHLLTWGNAYAEIERDGAGRVIALWPLLPTQVTPFRDERQGRRLRYRVAGVNGPDVLFDAADILHIPGLGFDGVTGYSPIRQARESLGLLAAAERFGATFFANGTTFGGALSHPKQLGQKGASNLRESIEAMHQGPSRAHRFLILEEGMNYTKFGVDPNDAQFLETRQFQIAEVARWFNLPLHKLREMEHSSVRANIEQEALDYYTSTLRPWLVRWEQEINRKLISPRERYIQFAEFLLEGVLRGDMATRYQAYATGRQWGWLSADDVRSLENQNPLPDGAGQMYLVPTNMAPADRIDEIITAQTRPPAPPAQPALPPAEDDDEDEADDAERAALLERIAAQAEAIGSWQARYESGMAALTAAETARTEAEARVADLSARLQAETEARQAVAGELAAAITERDRVVAEAEQAHEAHVTQVQTWEVEREDWRQTETAIRASVAALTEERDGLIRREAVLVAERDALVQRAAVATDMAEAIEVDTREKLQAAQDAFRARDEALAALATETARAAAADEQARTSEALRAVAQQEQAQAATAHAAHLTALATSARSVQTEVMGRLIRRETEKARSKRATPDKLRAWAESFYDDHEVDVWVEALTPVVRLHLALIGSDRPVEQAVDALVRAHMATSKRQILAVTESGAHEYQGHLDATLRRWETRRAEEWAEAFLREEIAYVRAIQ